jgi:hypothetical protein
MENNKTEFRKYLKILISKLHDTKPSTNTEKILKVFNKLNINKVSNRFYTITNPIYDSLDKKDDKIFANQLNIMPKVNLSDYWNLLNDKSKDKLWSLLNVLYVLSELIKKESTMENKTTTTTVETQEDSNNNEIVSSKEFNPYVGINTCSENYSISQMFGGPKDLPNEKKSSNNNMTNIGLMSQVGQLSKMIDMDKFSEDIKNINSDDIKEATNNIKNLLGGSSDEKTSNLISDMLDDITKELQTNNLSDGDPFQNIMKVAEKVAEKIKPKVEKDNIDLSTFMNSGDSNPMNLLNKMMGEMKNNSSKVD